MTTLSNSFIKELTKKIETIKGYYNDEAINSLSSLANELENNENKDRIDSPQGVPPPCDINDTYSSLSSSISIPDALASDQLGRIQDKNKEIHRAATIALKQFKNTSKDLLSFSQINSGSTSIILNELEIMKKTMNFVDKNLGKREGFRSNEMENCEVEAILNKIQEIQNQIYEAGKKLCDSEQLIMKTEENNQLLENRIQLLEDTVNLAVTEGPEKSSSEMCLCSLF